MLKRMRLIFLLLMSASIFSACSREPVIKHGHLQTVKVENMAHTLNYAGIIAPLHTRVIPSPADGVIVEMPFQYGDAVKPGQLLFLISSGKFLSDYKAALMQYIKAKSDFNISQSQLSEATFLHQQLLISDDDFTSKKTSFYGSQLALLQAKEALENLLRQLNMKGTDPFNLTIDDIGKITEALHLQHNAENLQIVAPLAGIVLAPNKSEESNKKLVKGDVVKQGDVLAMMGDADSVSVHIKVSEQVVNQLHLGQKVTVTGVAFPDESLSGEISQIDRQGETDSATAPTFAVDIVVPKLTSAQQKTIHIGMSASIEINTAEAPAITVPLVAIKDKDGVSMVKLYDSNKKAIRDIAIKTGRTSLDRVAVLTGLQSGDEIVIPD